MNLLFRSRVLVVSLLVSFSASLVFAENEIITLPIKDALASEAAEEELLEGIDYFWGDQKHAKPSEVFETDSIVGRKSKFRREIDYACTLAFVDTLLVLQKKSRDMGGNAVTNIVSNFDHKPWSSETEYQCVIGSTVVAVGLRGTFILLED